MKPLPLHKRCPLRTASQTAKLVGRMPPQHFGGWCLRGDDPYSQAREAGLHVAGNGWANRASTDAAVQSALRASRAAHEAP